MTRFEWDPAKDHENQRKHGVAFSEAQLAFADPARVIAEDLTHGGAERRISRTAARSRGSTASDGLAAEC